MAATLYEVMRTGRYYQVYHVYLSNDWDENTVVGRGTRAELLAQEYEATKDENMAFDYLNHEIDRLYAINDVMVVFINDEEHNKPVEEIWNEDIKKYNSMLPMEDKIFLSSTDIDKIAGGKING